MVEAILIILIFFVLAVLMYMRKIPVVIALPIMAISIGLVSGISMKDILGTVIADGSIRLSKAYIAVIFGAGLAQLLKITGIAERMVKNAAELAGDRPFIIAVVIVIVLSLLFSVLVGLSGVIIVGTVVFPVMLSIGISPLIAGCIFLFGLSLGGIFNLVNWALYIDVLKLNQNTIISFAWRFGLIYFIFTLIFLFIGTRRMTLLDGRGKDESSSEAQKRNIGWYAFLTPLVPLFLIFGFTIYGRLTGTSWEFPIVPALLCGLIYGVITSGKKGESRINLLIKCLFEGTSEVVPAVFLIIGIGMVLNSVTHPLVSEKLIPIISKILPGNLYSYIVFFAILAPLALYRGPLNIWGMGSGIVGIMLFSGKIPPAAIMGALLSVGQIQGICDPTNTHNVWIANYLDIDLIDILKKTLPYAWVIALFGLIISGYLYIVR